MECGAAKSGQAILASLALMASAAVMAAEPVSSHMEAYRVARAADGSEKLEAATAIKPGEVIEYQITYNNDDAKPVSDMLINAPVPASTVYLEGSARSPVRSQVRFSDDRGQTWQTAPLKHKRVDGNGEEVVAPERYTNVQWRAEEPLSKGKTQKYSYRVRVATNGPVKP